MTEAIISIIQYNDCKVIQELQTIQLQINLKLLTIAIYIYLGC